MGAPMAKNLHRAGLLQSVWNRTRVKAAELAAELGCQAPPSLAELRGHRLFFLEERRLLGLGAIDPDDFATEFRLMTIQRGLKATGTFSYQTAVSGRGAVYEPFIQPTLEIVLQAAEWLDRFPALRRMIEERAA